MASFSRPIATTSGSQAPVIYVVDDDPAFRTAIGDLLRACDYRVELRDSATDLLENPPGDAPACILLDVQMAGCSGPQLQDRLAALGSTPPIIFLTGHGDIPTSVQAMRLGAEDFLTKLAPKEALLEAVDRALARDARERAERARGEGARARFATLTDREREVLEHVLRGQLNKQIAWDLGIHERTVKLHRTAITNKVGVQSVAELTQLWMEAFPKGQ